MNFTSRTADGQTVLSTLHGRWLIPSLKFLYGWTVRVSNPSGRVRLFVAVQTSPGVHSASSTTGTGYEGKAAGA